MSVSGVGEPVHEPEAKRAPVDTGAIEGDRSGEAGRVSPDAPASKVRSVLVWSLTLAGVGLIGTSLAIAGVGLPVPVYPGWTVSLVVATPLLVLGGLICARKRQ